MSFVNLLDNVIFTDDDITNRTEAMVRNEFSAEAETIMNRKVSGAGLGVYTLTADDQAELARFAAVTQAAAMAGAEARADMERKRAVMAHEAAIKRLAMPVYGGPPVITDEDGIEQTHPDKARDDQERDDASLIVAHAGQDTLDLYALRNPAPEIPDEPTQEEPV